MSTERSGEGPPNAAKRSIFVISMERSDDDCMDAGGRATLEAKVEKSPYFANSPTRYLPAVDLTSWVGR
jgi:hypothetical protein